MTKRRRGRLRWMVALTLGASVAAAAPFFGAARADEKLTPPPPPDRGFYVEHIAEWVESKCMECHRDGGSALRFGPLRAGQSALDRRRADFERIRAFVNPNAPWESRLYLKLLNPADGGDPHVGGPFVDADDERHDTLLDFVSGATLSNVPPEVYLGETSILSKPGDKVVLDGRDSYDRDRGDMDKLVYWWELYAKPPGSIAHLPDKRASRFEFEPDMGGSYVFRLRVSDGKVWSAARDVAVEVFHHVAAKKRDPGGISGLEKLEVRRLRRVRRLYLDVFGRGPTPIEAIAENGNGIKLLANTILLRAESGRAWFQELAARYGLISDYRPASDEALALPLRIPSEITPPAVAEAVLIRDPSFLRRHPPGRALAHALIGLGLDRNPTDAEVNAAIELANEREVEMPGLGRVVSSRDWITQVLNSPAFARAAVRRRLARFLDSGDAESRSGAALAAIGAGGGAWRKLLEEILISEAYLGRKRLRPKDDLTFVRSLFFDLLERKPTDRELAASLYAVGQMPGRGAPLAALAKVMIDSGDVPIPLLVHIKDAPLWIKDRFLRYLGRPPTAAELKAYGEALLHPSGGPWLVLQALLTTPEYACR